MTAVDYSKLTRRRDPDRAECWFIFWRDIRAGTITRAVGMPNAVNCNWSVGFYPGSHPREIKSGCADTFEEARAKFLAAWIVFRTPEDFEAWRSHRDFTAWKYRMRDQGKPLPTQSDTIELAFSCFKMEIC